MKFCQYLKLVDTGSPAVFKGSYLNYKGLKKFLKYRGRRMTRVQAAERADLQITAERDIREMLCTQLRLVDRQFETEAKSILAKFDRLSKGPSIKLFKRNSKATEQAWKGLHARLMWTRRYARVNALALRKISKKHDKVLGSSTGHQFLQDCWRGHSVVKAFLGGPVHAELAAVQALLAKKTSAHEPPEGELPEEPQQASSAAVVPDFARTSGHAVSLDADMLESNQDDLTCPICMDLMYEPAALACGHTFCGQCCIRAAGYQPPQVSVVKELRGVPTRHAACPMCRTCLVQGGTQTVFEAAIELPHVGELIQQRFPAEWAARQEEERAGRVGLKAPRSSWFQGPVDVTSMLARRDP